MTSWRARVMFLATCVALAGAGGFLAGRSRQEPPAVLPGASRPEPLALAAAAAPGGGQSEFVAVVVARQDSLLTAKHEARLLRFAVKPGDRVRAGQVLAEMDRRALTAEVAGKQAELAAAQAQLAGAKSARAAAGKASRRARRLRDVMSATERERAEYESAAAGAAVREKAADVEALAAEVERMRVGAEEAELTAPHDGVVANTYVQPGQWLERGAELIRVVGDERAVRFAVPVELRAEIAIGDPMQFLADDGRTRFDVEVVEVARDVDAASRLVFVQARLIGADPAALADLLPGVQGLVRPGGRG